MEYGRKEDFGFIQWARAIKERDYYTCQICGKVGGMLHAHHMYSWVDNEDLRYCMDNGISLCKNHHEGFHEIYGNGYNTKAQYIEYKTIFEKVAFRATLDSMKRELSDKVKSDLLVQKIKRDLGSAKE